MEICNFDTVVAVVEVLLSDWHFLECVY